MPEEELYLSFMRTAEMLGRHVGKLLKKAGISHAQYNVMRILRAAGGDGLPCGEISARLITRDPDVTRLLDRLAERRLVERGRSRGDRRVVSARITAEGLNLLEGLDEPVMSLYKEQFGFLAEPDIRGLLEKLVRVRTNLN
jgi:DNA-binding MarR family transcriptional regulator